MSRIAWLSALSIFVSATCAAAPTVQIDTGLLSGEQTPSGGAIFRGIPYAAPPLGALRWREPQLPAKWTGIRDAAPHAPPCAQAFVGWNRDDAKRGSEDCLFVDVHTPRLDATAHLPVLVWIHGGANWAGSANWVVDSAIADRGIVVVTIQYRLGVFGFLSHSQLSLLSPNGVSGNYALLDQIAGLQWVQRNIAAFGGDPKAVTIAGHSAGGQDVGLLLLSPLARGLFARAIQQSGTAGFGLRARSLAENERIGERLINLVDPAPAANHAEIPGPGSAKSKQDLATLRALPAGKLLDAQMQLESPALDDNSYFFLQPVVDGWVIPSAPDHVLRNGKSAPVPVMIGNAAQELTLNGGDSSVWRVVTTRFGAAASAARSLYGLEDGNQPPDDPLLGNTGMQIADDLTFRCPSEFTATEHTMTGQPVWRFQMEVAAAGATRVDHGSELSFIFSNLPLDPAVDGKQPYLQTYWVNFVRTGDPNGPGVPQWPQYGAAKNYLRFTKSGPQPAQGLRSQICALIQRP